MTLYESLKESGVPIDNHYSDLYFLKTPESVAILKRFPLKHGLATMFKSQIDGKIWVEVPFSFDPFWDKVAERNQP